MAVLVRGGQGARGRIRVVAREVEGDLAYDIGYYTICGADEPEGSGARGKFIVIWKQGEDDTWRIHADEYSEVTQEAEEGP